MTDQIRVRVYNVRFGDAILVTVPDRNPVSGAVTRRHILFDVGNVLSGEGGLDSVFEPVVKDILQELGGKPLDLYVMTHEHLDHVQGLFHAATKTYPDGKLKALLNVRHSWLSASAAPDYYERHPGAKQQKKILLQAYQSIAAHLALNAGNEGSFGGLLANNNPRSTSQCVDFLRTLAPPGRTHYIHRGFKVDGMHPFDEVEFEIWAPEEDTSDYYSKGAGPKGHGKKEKTLGDYEKELGLLPMALSGGDDEGSGAPLPVLPPAGVDAGTFYNLVERRASGLWDNLLAIDRAANNTSVVLAMVWRGRRLLFAGDAELESWKMMAEKGVLKRIDFLKVSHHGSHNGTPEAEILDQFMPKLADGHSCHGVISTWTETYGGIPHTPTNDKLKDRCELHSILDSPEKLYFDAFIPEQAGQA